MSKTIQQALKGSELDSTTGTTEAPLTEAQQAEAARAEALKAQAEAWGMIRNQTPTVEGLEALRSLAEAWAIELRDSILEAARKALAGIQDTPFYVLSNSERRNVIATRYDSDIRFYGASVKQGPKGPYAYDPGTPMLLGMMAHPSHVLFIRGDGDATPSWGLKQLMAFERLAQNLGPEAMAALRETDPVLHTRAYRLVQFVGMFSALPQWEGLRARALAIEASEAEQAAQQKAEGSK